MAGEGDAVLGSFNHELLLGQRQQTRLHVACTEKRNLVAERKCSENAPMDHFTCNLVGFWILA